MYDQQPHTQTEPVLHPKRFRDMLFNEITLVVAIGGFLWGVFNYLNAPALQYAEQFAQINTNIILIQQSIHTIETNHEAHIQAALEEIATNKSDIKELKEELVEQSKQIVKLLTIIEGRR